MKKRMLCLFLCCALLLPLWGCAQANVNEETGEPTESASTESSAPSADSQTETETETETESETEPPAPKTAQILTKTLYLFEGQSFPLNYVARDPSGEVDFEISTDCVTVEGGNVTAIKEGHAVISAGEDSSCSVKILPHKMPELYVFVDGKKINSKEDYVACQVSVTTKSEEYTFLSEPAGIRLRGNLIPR